jgi:hypothetical protein
MKPPRQTEYRNVIFRSRSEAIFAHSLDRLKLLWAYEPAEFKQNDSWVFDFQVIFPGIDPGTLTTAFIEYKPAGVTSVTKRELTQRFRFAKGSNQIAILLVGCPFDPKVPRSAQVLQDDGTWNEEPEWLEALTSEWPEARKFRFDLESTW